MPFFWSPLPVPAAYWRHLESYDVVVAYDSAGPSVDPTAWKTIFDTSGIRGIIMSVANGQTRAVDYRFSLDGGAWNTFTMTNTSLSIMLGFSSSLWFQHLRTSSANGSVTTNVVYLKEQ